MTSATFSATFQNATVTFTYRLLTNFDNTKIVHLFVPSINTTIPAFTQYLSTTTTALPTVLRPTQNVFNICRVIINDVTQAGTILITPGGTISFSSIALTGFNTSTVWNGTPQLQSISYVFP